jgi:predicted transcriptional regulator
MNKNQRNNLSSIISKAVFVARTRCGFTQEMLAKKVGTMQSGIARLENSKHLPSFSLILRIAEVLEQNILFSFEPKNKNDVRFVNMSMRTVLDVATGTNMRTIAPSNDFPYVHQPNSSAAHIYQLSKI